MILFPWPETEHSKKTKQDNEKVKWSPFLILLVAMMLGGIAYRGSTVTLPAYLELKSQNFFLWFTSFIGINVSKNLMATSITSVIFIIGMAGQYMGGIMAMRFDLRRCYLLFHSITIPAVLLMAVFSDIPLVILAIVYFFFLLGMQPIENTLVARFTPVKFRHSAYGSKFILTFGVGALAVKMVEAIKTHSEIESVFFVLGAVSLALVCVIVLLIFNTQKIRVVQ